MDFEKPIKVFIDTNVFETACFWANDKKLQSIKKLSINKDIKPIISNVNLFECERHIRRNIEQGLEKFNQVQKPWKDENGKRIEHSGFNAMFAILRNDDKYGILSNRIKEVEKEDIVQLALMNFKNFLKEAEFEVLDCQNADVAYILDRWFESKAPFDKAKKNEFPDAFFVSALKNSLLDWDSLYIVSDDIKIRECFDEPNAYTFANLEDFLNSIYVNVREEIINFLNTDENTNKITDDIAEVLQSAEISVDGHGDIRNGDYGYDYEETELISVEKITLISHKVIEFEKDEGYATVVSNCEAELKFQCSFFDEDASIWDGENKEYIYNKYGTFEEVHNVELEIEIGIEFTLSEGKNEYTISYIDTDSIDNLAPDYFTLQGEKELIHDPNEFDENKFFYDKGLEPCPGCGNWFERGTMGGTGYCPQCSINH